MSAKSDREFLAIFSANLRQLVEDRGSITAISRELGINRTQLNRYLSGEGTPRPLILKRICDHFGVDARILTEPLGVQSNETERRAQAFVDTLLKDIRTPPPADIIPDGLFAEWTLSLQKPGMVRFQVLQILTEDGIRKTRVKWRDQVRPDITGLLRTKRKVTSQGLLYKQGAGFAVLDHIRGSDIVTLTSFKVGHGADANIYTGIKLCGASFVPFLSHCATCCILQPLPEDHGSFLSAIRQPLDQPLDSAPGAVGHVLTELSKSGFMSPYSLLWPSD